MIFCLSLKIAFENKWAINLLKRKVKWDHLRFEAGTSKILKWGIVGKVNIFQRLNNINHIALL